MRDRALEYLEAADVYRSLVRELHDANRVDYRAAKRAEADCGFALKAAEVCATLAAADAIAGGHLADIPVPDSTTETTDGGHPWQIGPVVQ